MYKMIRTEGEFDLDDQSVKVSSGELAGKGVHIPVAVGERCRRCDLAGHHGLPERLDTVLEGE